VRRCSGFRQTPVPQDQFGAPERFFQYFENNSKRLAWTLWQCTTEQVGTKRVLQGHLPNR
jgi:hypothetical protein